MAQIILKDYRITNIGYFKPLRGILKLRRQDFAIFDPHPLQLRWQVYYISLCSSIGIWLPLSPSPAYVV